MKFLIIPGAILALIYQLGRKPAAGGGGSSSWDKPTWQKSPLEAFTDWILGGFR